MKMPMPRKAKVVGTQFGPEPSGKQPMMKTLPSLADPKSPAGEPTVPRCHSMPEFPKWGAPTRSKFIKKLPSLSDPKS